MKCLYQAPAEEIEEVYWSAVYAAEFIQKIIVLLVVGVEQHFYAFIDVQALMQDITAGNVLTEDQLNDVVMREVTCSP